MTKYLVLVLVIALVLWWARSARSKAAGPRRRAAPRALQAMVPCAHCGVHLPLGETVTGGLGVYCCDEHRRLHGDRAA